MLELAAYACLALQVVDGQARTGDELLDVDDLDGEQLLCIDLEALADNAERTTDGRNRQENKFSTIGEVERNNYT